VPTPPSVPPTTPVASVSATMRPSPSTVPIPLGGAADSQADGRPDVSLPTATAVPLPTQSQTPSPSPTCDPSPSPSPTPTCPSSSPIEDPNDEPIDSPADDDFGASSAQDDLYFVGARVLTIVEDHLDLYPGYGGLVADVPTRTLRLYWHQMVPPPAEIMEIVAAPGRPVTVELLDAPFGRLNLNEARDLLVANADSLDGQLCGFLHTFLVPQDASAVVVRIEPDYELTDPAAYISTAQSILTALAGYPVRVELAPAFEDTIGRRDDGSPWYAGAAIKEVNKAGGCSSGFGVVKDTSKWVLTAAHCFKDGVKVETVAGTEIGKVSDLREKMDTERISADAVAGRTYVKGVNSNESLQVNAPGWNMVGLFVCTSGAATGMNCHLKITDLDAKVRKLLKVVAENQVIADATKQRWDAKNEKWIPGVAVGGGDSGGPVILISNDPTTNHEAAGIISAGESANNFLQNHKVACNMGHKSDGRCYSRIAYTAIRPILKEYGVTLAP